MHKRLILILAIISLLATLFGVAAAPVTTAETKSVRLVSVGYYREKGVVFRFKLTGDFKAKELKGSLQVEGQTIKVYCVRNTKNTSFNAQCVAASITNRLAGKQGIITFAGSTFTAIIPGRPR